MLVTVKLENEGISRHGRNTQLIQNRVKKQTYDSEIWKDTGETTAPTLLWYSAMVGTITVYGISRLLNVVTVQLEWTESSNLAPYQAPLRP